MAEQSATALAAERAAKIADAPGWGRIPAVEGRTVCLTCGAGEDKWIAVGFGAAGVTLNGSHVWDEMDTPDDVLTFADAERLAAARPDNDWRIYMHAARYDAVYQRQGEGVWALIESGEGFA